MSQSSDPWTSVHGIVYVVRIRTICVRWVWSGRQADAPSSRAALPAERERASSCDTLTIARRSHRYQYTGVVCLFLLSCLIARVIDPDICFHSSLIDEIFYNF
ncbi:unnamed protein product, partial [Brenthis ino]